MTNDAMTNDATTNDAMTNDTINDNPDKFIEEFWLHFKKSMINYYKTTKLRPIDEWSNKLNYYQSKKNYIEIEKHILNYISLYAIDLMRDDLIRNDINYHMNILVTNIKRWKKVLKNYDSIIVKNDYYNIIFLLIDIYKSIMYDDKFEKSRKIIFSQLELILLYKDFTELVKYAVDNNKPSILEKISKFCDIDCILLEYYNITVKDNLL
uniref:Uncharacterized protein n=1 Tax=viral metagenome TaxID=1070528 RepID=A0A6C0EP16_9ZZZZ